MSVLIQNTILISQGGSSGSGPCPSKDQQGTETMHVGCFSRGFGKFNAVEHRPPPRRGEDPSPDDSAGRICCRAAFIIAVDAADNDLGIGLWMIFDSDSLSFID